MSDLVPLLSVTTTVATPEDARKLARVVLAARLAACVQIEPITSLYPWEDRLCEEPEQRLTFKTLAPQLDGLRALVLANHPYTLPQWVVMQAGASPAYAGWVGGSVGPA